MIRQVSSLECRDVMSEHLALFRRCYLTDRNTHSQAVSAKESIHMPRTSITVFVSLSLFCGGLSAGAQVQRVDLDHGWEFRQVITPSGGGADVSQSQTQRLNSVFSTWRPATVPGDIHLDL